jgi:protoporphyrin/coproporphyrin ferrochelatase
MKNSSPLENSPVASCPRQLALPEGHVPVKSGRVGVLLTNLGTPEGTDYWSMRAYLKEFLSDRRVIEVSRWLWWPILNFIILSVRPSKKGKDYASIWNHERNESPLKTITRAQAEGLSERLQKADLGDVKVDWAMRYGFPAIKERIQVMMDEGCDRILVMPLYPHYAGATTATACDHVFRALMKMRWQPTVRISPPYQDEPVFIDALARSLKAGLAKLDFEPEVVLATFHGMPQEYLTKGDPYHCHCVKTYRLLREAMVKETGWAADRFQMSFQSRFGPTKWLQPYTDKTVEALAKKGIKKIVLIAPAFSADCLETLEELEGENRHIFEEHGGEKFAYIPCLNASEEGLDLIEFMARRELMGWV